MKKVLVIVLAAMLALPSMAAAEKIVIEANENGIVNVPPQISAEH